MDRHALENGERVGISGPRSFWSEIRRASGDPLVGLHAAERLDTSSLGKLRSVLRPSTNLRAAIELASRFLSLVESSRAPHLRVEGDRAILEWRRTTSQQDSDFILLVAHRCGQWLYPGIHALEVNLPHIPPSDLQGEYERVFGCPVRFGADRVASVFPAEWLDRPLPNADESEQSRMVRDAEHAPRADPGGSFLEVIERTYSDAVAIGEADADAIAKRLGVSVRTLRRRLAELDTSHREQRDKARLQSAQRLLRESRCSLREIALRVGFSDVAAFTRAFRRWVGTTPGAYRRYLERAVTPESLPPPVSYGLAADG